MINIDTRERERESERVRKRKRERERERDLDSSLRYIVCIIAQARSSTLIHGLLYIHKAHNGYGIGSQLLFGMHLHRRG